MAKMRREVVEMMELCWFFGRLFSGRNVYLEFFIFVFVFFFRTRSISEG